MLSVQSLSNHSLRAAPISGGSAPLPDPLPKGEGAGPDTTGALLAAHLLAQSRQQTLAAEAEIGGRTAGLGSVLEAAPEGRVERCDVEPVFFVEVLARHRLLPIRGIAAGRGEASGRAVAGSLFYLSERQLGLLQDLPH